VTQASGINKNTALQPEYQAIHAQLSKRIGTIRDLVNKVASSPDPAKQILTQVQGVAGLKGAVDFVKQALDLNSRAANGG